MLFIFLFNSFVHVWKQKLSVYISDLCGDKWQTLLSLKSLNWIQLISFSLVVSVGNTQKYQHTAGTLPVTLPVRVPLLFSSVPGAVFVFIFISHYLLIRYWYLLFVFVFFYRLKCRPRFVRAWWTRRSGFFWGVCVGGSVVDPQQHKPGFELWLVGLFLPTSLSRGML